MAAIKESRGDRVFYTVHYIFLAQILLIVAYPLIYIVACSFSNPQAVLSGKVWLWPVDPMLQGYTTVFQDRDVMTGYANSIFYTVVGTVCALVMTMLAAYPLSRKDYSLSRPVMLIFTFTMYFGGGLIPSYLLYSNMGLVNTRTIMILPGILSVYNVIITRTFIQSSIPQSLHEAAELDGCSDFRYLVSIVVPLSKAVMAVIALYYAISYWNSYFMAMIYLYDRAKYPLQMFLREILIENQMSAEMLSKGQISVEEAAARQAIYELLKYSLIIVASVPGMLFYPFIQKYFVKGVMIGGIKG